MIAKLPASLRADPQSRSSPALRRRGAVSIVHLINRHDTKSSDFKDYEFSRATVTSSGAAGQADVQQVARKHPDGLQRRPTLGNGVRVFDLPSRRDTERTSA